MNDANVASLERPPAGLFHSEQRRLLWINLLGGPAVLASYAWGFLAHPETVGALWGGVPELLRPAYTTNMLLAATGYFFFTSFVLFRIPPEEARIGGFGYGLFHALYLAILLPSALWMPLTFLMLESPSPLLWWVVRLDLAAVGLGALGLLVALVTLRPRTAPRWRGLAIAGVVPFLVQTGVLDALIWPAYFAR